MKNFHMRRNAYWMVTAGLLVAGCGGSSPTGAGGGGAGGGSGPVEATSVTVGNNFFSPEPILVSPGERVTWTWAGGGNVHNVTFASNAIPSSRTQLSGSYQAVMPTEPGVYAYQCTIHPSSMNGLITVQ